jgi:DNA-binding response OmpR family regulator
MKTASYLPKPATYWFAHDCRRRNMEFCRIMDFNGVMDVNGVKTILVVDSALAVQQFQREMIESQGYKTKGVTDFHKGYNMLVNYQRQIDLVVIDHQSQLDPVDDLIEKIRTNAELERMPVILLMAESDNFAGKANDLLRVIRKPYRPDFLLSEIKRLTRSEQTI